MHVVLQGRRRLCFQFKWYLWPDFCFRFQSGLVTVLHRSVDSQNPSNSSLRLLIFSLVNCNICSIVSPTHVLDCGSSMIVKMILCTPSPPISHSTCSSNQRHTHLHPSADVIQDTCPIYGCLLEVTILLFVIMAIRQFVLQFREVLTPRFFSWLNKCMANLEEEEGELSDEDYVSQAKSPWSVQGFKSAYPRLGLHEEYMEMMIQFGFVALFVTPFPIAALFAFLNNLTEKHVDAIKFVRHYQRPFAPISSGLGVWYDILNFVGGLAVISNATIIAITSNFIPRLVYQYSNSLSLTGYVDTIYTLSETEQCYYRGYDTQDNIDDTFYWRVLVARIGFIIAFEHVVFSIKMILAAFVSDIPRDIMTRQRREEYQLQLMVEHTLHETSEQSYNFSIDSDPESDLESEPEGDNDNDVFAPAGPLTSRLSYDPPMVKHPVPKFHSVPSGSSIVDADVHIEPTVSSSAVRGTVSSSDVELQDLSGAPAMRRMTPPAEEQEQEHTQRSAEPAWSGDAVDGMGQEAAWTGDAVDGMGQEVVAPQMPESALQQTPKKQEEEHQVDGFGAQQQQSNDDEEISPSVNPAFGASEDVPSPADMLTPEQDQEEPEAQNGAVSGEKLSSSDADSQGVAEDSL
eukprot:m.23853 g.23853  ORF g.23853 m.23853 type:complete len:629 (-) comp8536_c0_seq2:333-2219(-)